MRVHRHPLGALNGAHDAELPSSKRLMANRHHFARRGAWADWRRCDCIGHGDWSAGGESCRVTRHDQVCQAIADIIDQLTRVADI